MTTAMIGEKIATLIGSLVRRERTSARAYCSYSWSLTVIPKASMPSTCCRSVASFPASVVIGRAVPAAMMTVVSTSIPSHRGCATTDCERLLGGRDDAEKPCRKTQRGTPPLL